MLNILARKREEEKNKAKKEKELKKNKNVVNVSKACRDRDLNDKKNQHEEMSLQYLKSHPGTAIVLSELDRQKEELEEYYEEKRRNLMTNLVTALQEGAAIHFEEQKEILWKEYRLEFLPNLVSTMCDLIADNARIVFSTENTIDSGEFFSRTPGIEEASLQEKISTLVAVYLDESRKRVLHAAEEQCAQLTLKSMDIMTKRVLDIENYWKEKTKRDVENFHRLKMQEMTYRLDEPKEVTTEHCTPRKFSSPRLGQKLMKSNCSKIESDDECHSERDNYYLQAQQVKKDICNSAENITQEIRYEHFIYSPSGAEIDSETEKLDIDQDDSSSLKGCFSSIAEMRKMNLEAEMFLQRMESFSSNLNAEYDALWYGLEAQEHTSNFSLEFEI